MEGGGWGAVLVAMAGLLLVWIEKYEGRPSEKKGWVVEKRLMWYVKDRYTRSQYLAYESQWTASWDAHQYPLRALRRLRALGPLGVPSYPRSAGIKAPRGTKGKVEKGTTQC